MVEDDDMRALFFDPDDFGQEATITPTAGQPFTVLGIFDYRPVEPRAIKGAQVGFDGGMQNTGNHPQFQCRTIDVPDVKAGRGTLAVAGKVFNIWDVKPDHTGMTLIILKVGG